MVVERRHHIADCVYVDADTGKEVNRIPMRIFYVRDANANKWEMVRSYELRREDELNPGFQSPPQGNRAFPGKQERY